MVVTSVDGHTRVAATWVPAALPIMPMSIACAYSRDDAPESEWEPLERHLLEVAQKVRESSEAFDSCDWGFLTGR